MEGRLSALQLVGRGCAGAGGILRQIPGRGFWLVPLPFQASAMAGGSGSGELSLGPEKAPSPDFFPECIGGGPARGQWNLLGSFHPKS